MATETYMKKNIVTLLFILVFMAIGLANLKAQSWDDGIIISAEI